MFIEAMNLFLPVILLFLTFVIVSIFRLSSTRRPPIPPGPLAWPIVGNLFQLGNSLHIRLAKLAEVHGPIISLRVASQLLIVGSSPEAAAEILKTHDSILSGRHLSRPIQAKDSKLHNLSMSMSDKCDDGWKSFKALYRAELFSAKALESQAELRANKVMEMLNYLASREGQVVKIRQIVFATLLNILSNVTLSIDFVDFEGNGVGKGMRKYIRKFAEKGAMAQSIDLLPIFGRWNLQSMNQKIMNVFEKMCASWLDTLKEKRMRKIGAADRGDFADGLIGKGFSDGQINTLLQEIFSAGTDTTTSTTEWALTELIRNQEAMHKLRDELTAIIGKDITKDSYLPHLVYLEACVKETLRLHPPGPLLLPHRAVETCEVMGYTIPKESQIIVNVWAISRDPKFWKDPLSFKPERFLTSKLDYKGQDFEFLPFGSGRRMCPGQPLASKLVPLILASLIHTFDWLLPDNMNPEDIDLREVLDIAMQKEKPLRVIPKLRKQLNNQN